MTKIIGIETSCDETAIGIVNHKKEILANVVFSQIKDHKPYGGVVPEIAARSHINQIHKLLDQVKMQLNDVDGIAVTTGPGLIGGLIVGIMTAKALSHSIIKPIIEVNHLEGHALIPRLTNTINFPYLLLLVSGGHCQILLVENVSKYKLIGDTKDDSLGETFDKLARMLDLGYPGGPVIEKYALKGDNHSFTLPKPLYNQNNCDFSFSGLKTSLKQLIQNKFDNHISIKDKENICASFQYTAFLILKDRISKAIDFCQKNNINTNNIVISGGVAANNYLKNEIKNFALSKNWHTFYPPTKLCTDNGVMIAWAGLERYQKGYFDDLSIEPKARWSLESL